ncbi:MAG: hypothetical protein JXA60_03115 [Candidatus Coatesbacteria bacterium]|nr:hypothetical protein [Candidatus Coatesbacteria bacterium]
MNIMLVRYRINYLLYVFFFMVFYLLSQNGFWIVDEANKILPTISSKIYKTWSFRILYKGSYLDKEGEFFPFRGPFAYRENKTEYRTVHSPVYSFMLYASNKLFGSFGFYLWGFISGFLILYLFSKISQTIWDASTQPKEMLLLLFFFCIPYFFYCLVLWEHIISVVFFLAALFFYIKKRTELCYLFLSINVFFRTELLLFVILFAIFERIKDIKAILVIILVMLAWLAMNYFVYGSLLGAHFEANMGLSKVFSGNLVNIIIEKARVYHGLLFQASNNILLSIFFGIAWLTCAFMIRFKERNEFLAIYTAIHIVFFAISIFDNDPANSTLKSASLFHHSPIFFLLIFRKDYSAYKTWLYAALSFILIFGLISPLNGGMQWGARFLLPFYSLAGILIWNSIRDLFNKGLRRCVYLLCLLSVSYQLLGLHTLYYKKKATAEILDYAKKADSIIVSNIWWYPFYLIPLYAEKDIFYCSNPKKLFGFLLHMEDSGIKEFTFTLFSDEFFLIEKIMERLPIKEKERITIRSYRMDFIKVTQIRYSLEPFTANLREQLAISAWEESYREELFEAALWYNEKLRNMLPESPVYHYHAYLTYKKLSNSKEALRELLKAVELDPNNYKLRLELSEIKSKL